MSRDSAVSGNMFREYSFLFLVLIIRGALNACGGSGSGSLGGGGGTGNGGTNRGPFSAGRMKYVRTDATTEYFQFDNPHWIIYNPITKYFYVTDPWSNHLFVLDSVTLTKVAAISVPGAFSIDDSADHKTLYLGTLIGDVYTVDPIALDVTHRYIASQIGPSGYRALSAVVLADGRLALLATNGGLSADGSTNYALWNPTNNSFSLGTGYCDAFGSLEGISRTVDRTKIVLSN